MGEVLQEAGFLVQYSSGKAHLAVTFTCSLQEKMWLQMLAVKGQHWGLTWMGLIVYNWQHNVLLKVYWDIWGSYVFFPVRLNRI